MDARWIVALALVAILTAVGADADEPRTPASLDRALAEIAQLRGEPSVAESVGVTRGDVPIRSLESQDPLDGPKRRLVLIGGLDGDPRSVEATLGAVRWFKTRAPRSLREGWTIITVPCGNPEGWVRGTATNGVGGEPGTGYPPSDRFYDHPTDPEARYLQRWASFQAPDLLIEVRGGDRLAWLEPVPAPNPLPPDSLPHAFAHARPSQLGPCAARMVFARATDGAALLQAALKDAANLPRSPLREAIVKRLARPPLEVARTLAGRYPRSPSVTYIPAVAWTATLRLSRLTDDPALAAKVREAAAPYLAGERPSIAGQPDGTKLAGHILFADLAEHDRGEAARRLALDAAARLIPEEPAALARYGRLWTDDMFFACTLLGRAGRLSGEAKYHDLAARTLLQYAEQLQRPDGIFIHAPDAPHAWGRGNGFAALGLMEALTYLPAEHPQRDKILGSYRKQMAALLPLQTPEGTWRQVIDRPESYREVTATAMNLAAMARGVRLGWLDRSYRRVVERAWRGLSARIAEDGTLVDVCTGTGAGPTRRYYYDRPAVSGFDDRGGAMSLLAAVEVAELLR